MKSLMWLAFVVVVASFAIKMFVGVGDFAKASVGNHNNQIKSQVEMVFDK